MRKGENCWHFVCNTHQKYEMDFFSDCYFECEPEFLATSNIVYYTFHIRKGESTSYLKQ